MHKFSKHILSVVAAIVLVAAVIALVADLPKTQTPDFASADAFVRHLELIVPVLLREHGVPGAAVGLLRDGEPYYLQGFGFADAAAEAPITPRTLFNVGSISKTVTAWAAMRLSETQRLDLDSSLADVVDRWPWPETHQDEKGSRNITARLLLSHRAGLGAHAVPEILPWEPLPSLEDWLGSGEVSIETPPGTAWEYSGGGYALLELAIESLTKQRFAPFVRDEILEPLGMRRSTLDFPAGVHDLARPHAAGKPIPSTAGFSVIGRRGKPARLLGATALQDRRSDAEAHFDR